MNAHYNNTNKTLRTEQNIASKSDSDSKNKLDRVAEELSNIAKRRLPDGVLQGLLRGLEGDIRQDAILLSLSWYMRQNNGAPDQSVHPWLAPRAISAALRIQKQAYSTNRKRELEALQSVFESELDMDNHPIFASMSNWPSPAMKRVVIEAIRIAVSNEKISLLNASVALEVLVNYTPVSELAKNLGVHRSSIYQHLNRVRKVIPKIIDAIEVPLHELT